MSHQPERLERDCLNCGTVVQGRFCHVCGQENIITKQSFWHLTRHFFEDLTHFDGKFFSTLKSLLLSPGKTAHEYTAGRRKKFLEPVRMYLFTSAIFFLTFFSLTKDSIKMNVTDAELKLTREDRAEMIAELEEDLKKNPDDSATVRKISLLRDTTRPVKAKDIYTDTAVTFIKIDNENYRSVSEYDSVQQSLAAEKRDSWLKRVFQRQGLAIGQKYRANKQEGIRNFFDALLHRFPYMLFVSLPFFAGILKLLYIRRRQFYYSDHAVFTLYHYVFSFILLLIMFGINAFANWSGWTFVKFLVLALVIYWIVYLFISMRRFYGQRGFKTFTKFLLLNILGLILIILLFIFFLIFSIFQF